MRNTRRARGLIAGVGLAIVALTLAACGSGAGAADGSAETAPPTTDAGDAAGGAAGIVESGSGEADPELIGVSDAKRRPAVELVAGKTYTPVSATGFAFVDPAKMTFTFTAEGGISIIGGCNTQFGALQWDGEFAKAPALASTMMACDQPLMDQDFALSTLFAAGFATDVTDGTLTLTNDDATIVLAEKGAAGQVPVPDPAGSTEVEGD